MIAPPAASLFEPVTDRYGPRLALVFGNQAPQGRCPYYAANRCHHCDIGAGEGHRFDTRANRERLDWFRSHYASVLDGVCHLVVYNSGSTLNPVELAPEFLREVIEWASGLPNLSVISLDSREAFITADRLLDLTCRLRPHQALRPILGLESADERVRNLLLDKKMSDGAIQRALGAIAQVPGCSIDFNVVVGGPGTTARTAVGDALATVRAGLRWSLPLGLIPDFNLHPYHPSARGQARFPGHGRCSLTLFVRVVEGLCALLRSEAPGTGLFIGWQDEGHDQQQDVRGLELSMARTSFDRFNQTQDSAALGELYGAV